MSTLAAILSAPPPPSLPKCPLNDGQHHPLKLDEAKIWVETLTKYVGQYFRDGHSRHFTVGRFVNCFLRDETDLVLVGESLVDATGLAERKAGKSCEFSYKLDDVVIIDYNPTPQEIEKGDGFYAQIFPRAQIYLQVMIGDVA